MWLNYPSFKVILHTILRFYTFIFVRLKINNKIFFLALTVLSAFYFSSCKKDKIITDPSATVRFSQDSILFDTVFTQIGSATKNFRIINGNKQKIKISSINLIKGNSSSFIVNVDGAPGKTFTDIEIAANDSMYVFVQVNIDPNNINSPFIVQDILEFNVNGNIQKVKLEAWGQNAYYHYPTDAIKFKDGSYLPYSLVDALASSYSVNGTTFTFNNDKPHVVYGYLVVDSLQKLIVQPGTRFFMNYKAGLWVYKDGEMKIQGQLGNEVTFQGARRESDYADEPGQWDRIWINEGSNHNEINYAIIKNAYIGVQTEVIGNTIGGPGRLKLTNTKIQNMSMWGLYSLAYNIYGANNVISNCQEYSVNLLLGGKYTFLHCTFANYWEKDKARDKPTLFVNNHTTSQVLPLDSCYFGNCIIDGKLTNEIGLDLDYSNLSEQPNLIFSSTLFKTDMVITNPTIFIANRKIDSEMNYMDRATYNFKPKDSEVKVKGFTDLKATQDAAKVANDIEGSARNTSTVTVGAYQTN